MKIFENTTALAAATLTAGQMVSVKEVGEYRIKASGSGITLANGNIAVPVASGTAVNVLQFGADPTGVADNTPVYAAMVAALPEGTTIVWPKGTYKGDFVSTKAFKLIGNGSTIIPVGASTCFKLEGSLGSYSALSAAPSYGDVSLTGVTGLTDDALLLLYSGTTRPSDSAAVNYEIVKVDSSGNVLDRVYSEQDGGTPQYAVVTPISDVLIEGFNFESSTNTSASIYIRYAENVVVRDIAMNGGSGSTVSIRNTYNASISNIRRIKPSATGSGQGYNVALVGTKYVDVRKVYGQGCRHDFDQDSSYVTNVYNVHSVNAGTSAIVVAHNGFAGHTIVRDCTVRGDGYAVSTSSQGAASPNSLLNRQFTIENIDIVNNVDMTTYNFYVGIYLQNPTESLNVRNIKLHNANNATSFDYAGAVYNTGYFAVRLYELRDLCSIENVEVDAATNVIRVDQGSSIDTRGTKLNVRGIKAERFENLVNIVAPEVFDEFTFNDISYYDSATVYGNALINIVGSNRIRKMMVYGISKISPYTKVIDLNGNPAAVYSKIDTASAVMRNSSLNGLAASGTVTQEEYLTRGDFGIWGSTTKSLSATEPFEAPVTTGNKFVIFNYGAGTLTIPGGSNTVDSVSDIVMAAGSTYYFQANNAGTKWRLFCVETGLSLT